MQERRWRIKERRRIELGPVMMQHRKGDWRKENIKARRRRKKGTKEKEKKRTKKG